MSKKSVVIVDYGLGNLFNVERAFEFAGAQVVISSDQQKITQADRIVMPGVGAFEEGMLGLRKRNLIDSIKEFSISERPLIGICLGMQLLMSYSEELGLHEGLNIVKGNVLRLQGPCKIPQIGWNELLLSDYLESWDKTVLKCLDSKPHMYFLHSFAVKLEDPTKAIANTQYGKNLFCSVFQDKNIIGIQPHVERSGEEVGIRVLRNFLEL